jgi:ribosomal protein S18 acetylase RimI-like enzyme
VEELMEITIRTLKKEDLPSMVLVDSAVTSKPREAYYKRKIDEVFAIGMLSCSLAAEVDGNFAGFLIGQVFEGEFGIPGDSAYIDTLGIGTKYHKLGIGSRLMEQFISNMKAANVKKIYTLVDFADVRLIKFFGGQGFNPSKRLSLELELF